MNHEYQKAVFQYAGVNNPPEPIKPILHRVLAGLIVHKRRSLICHEIDECIDIMCDIKDRMDKAIEEGDLLGLLVEKDAMAREKGILKGLERLLDMEAGVIKENQDMEQAKERAREYPMEQLLSEYGCQVKFRRTRCPIHEGKNQSSFEVKDNKGRCHSCGWYGDTIELVRKMEGCSFHEAVRKLQ